MTQSKREFLVGHYAQSHRDKRNETLHCICVPAILFAAVGLMFAANFGLVLLAMVAALVYYYRLGARTAMGMGLVLFAMLLVWMFLIPPHHIVAVAAVILGLGWAGQFVGHGYEGAKPSFTEDLQYLLVGPVYVLDVLRKRFV